MTKKMLQFVDLKKENPPKRDVKKRSQDFNEIYNEFINNKAKLSNTTTMPRPIKVICQ